MLSLKTIVHEEHGTSLLRTSLCEEANEEEGPWV